MYVTLCVFVCVRVYVRVAVWVRCVRGFVCVCSLRQARRESATSFVAFQCSGTRMAFSLGFSRPGFSQAWTLVLWLTSEYDKLVFGRYRADPPLGSWLRFPGFTHFAFLGTPFATYPSAWSGSPSVCLAPLSSRACGRAGLSLVSPFRHATSVVPGLCVWLLPQLASLQSSLCWLGNWCPGQA